MTVVEDSAARTRNWPSPPAMPLLLLEGRAVAELVWFYQSLPLLRRLPKGDGHPVLVLPGFMGSDFSTTPMRGLLRQLGYGVAAWGLGRNVGLRPGVEVRMIRRLRSLYYQHGRKVSVIGWSLGGIYARELARQHPEMVRLVVTLASPFNLSPRANHAWRLYERVAGERIDDQRQVIERLAQPLEVPATAVYTRTDGIVAWQCCLDVTSDRAENVEVHGSHCGLGNNPLALAVVADRLAQPEGEWRPFERQGWRRFGFPTPVGSPFARPE